MGIKKVKSSNNPNKNNEEEQPLKHKGDSPEVDENPFNFHMRSTTVDEHKPSSEGLLSYGLGEIDPRTLGSCDTGQDMPHKGYDKCYCNETDAAPCNTKVRGVLGLGAPVKCNGRAIEIMNIEDTKMGILWTDGLSGCLAIAILGRNAQGKTDVFFTHASGWTEPNASTDPNNPISHAHQFIKSHAPCRVFWGTDFGKLEEGTNLDKVAARLKLSKALEYPILPDEDFMHGSKFCFFPKLGVLTQGNPQQGMQWLQKQCTVGKLGKLVDEGNKRFMSTPAPDKQMLELVDDAAKQVRCKFIEKNKKKLAYLQNLRDAYSVNNIKELERLEDFDGKYKKYKELHDILIESATAIRNGKQGPSPLKKDQDGTGCWSWLKKKQQS